MPIGNINVKKETTDFYKPKASNNACGIIRCFIESLKEVKTLKSYPSPSTKFRPASVKTAKSDNNTLACSAMLFNSATFCSNF